MISKKGTAAPAKRPAAKPRTMVKISTRGIWQLIGALSRLPHHKGPGFVIKFTANNQWSLDGESLKKSYSGGPGTFTLTFNPHSLNLSDIELIIDPDPGGNQTGNPKRPFVIS